MRILKNKKLRNGGLAFILLGLVFASVPFFQIFHNHAYSNDTTKVAHIKDYESNCCNPIKIQSHFNGILFPQEIKIKLSFVDTYSFTFYNYSFKNSISFNNKAPPLNQIV
ncbi:hypothetical protein A5893_06515 [Pedobacter psychrophilus]|uniref:Uncharacterized protein n=1 Tax=Pedobacter psychrophilus TaxID=1826909 RepID=A0A179DJJ1_9SPHI|nr:hypothetical protein [Pedobacter psychrophilus]OAQ40593.1 hypothetical protein A5893_06515 [Pedobacter psychrophilus]